MFWRKKTRLPAMPRKTRRAAPPRLEIFQLDNVIPPDYASQAVEAHNQYIAFAKQRAERFGWRVLSVDTKDYRRIREGDRVIRSKMEVQRTSWWATQKRRVRLCWQESRGLWDFYHLLRWEWSGRWA